MFLIIVYSIIEYIKMGTFGMYRDVPHFQTHPHVDLEATHQRRLPTSKTSPKKCHLAFFEHVEDLKIMLHPLGTYRYFDYETHQKIS